MSESRLAPGWATLKASGRKALIPYLTAGYPTAQDSADALRSAAEVADIIEVGVPFSDPLADGPTIQRSTFEALRQGMTLAGTLELISSTQPDSPVVTGFPIQLPWHRKRLLPYIVLLSTSPLLQSTNTNL